MFRDFSRYLFAAVILLYAAPVFSQDTIPWFVRDTAYNDMLSQAIDFQKKADSLMSIASRQRKEMMYMDDSQKKGKLQVEVTRIEQEADQWQEWADDIFAGLPLSGGGETGKPARDSLLILDTVIHDIRVYHYNLEALVERVKPGEETAGKDETVLKEEPEAPANQFQIQKESPYSGEHPFEHAFELPEGPFYRIQLAAYGNPVGYGFFGGISPITTEVTEQGITRYYAGKFVSYEAAGKALGRIQAAGYHDAFLVGYFNGRRMAPEQVREYEKNNK